MDGAEAKAIAGTEGAHVPFFSPDGQWIGFFAQGKLKKVPADGGAAQVAVRRAEWHGRRLGRRRHDLLHALQHVRRVEGRGIRRHAPGSDHSWIAAKAR